MSAQSWSNVGPCDGKYVCGQWHSVGGQRYSTGPCLLWVAAEEMLNFGIFIIMASLTKAHPYASSVYPSVPHMKGLHAFPLLFTCMISNESLQHLREQSRTL